MFASRARKLQRSHQVVEPIGGIFEQHLLLEMPPTLRQWVTSFSLLLMLRTASAGGAGAVKLDAERREVANVARLAG